MGKQIYKFEVSISADDEMFPECDETDFEEMIRGGLDLSGLYVKVEFLDHQDPD